MALFIRSTSVIALVLLVNAFSLPVSAGASLMPMEREPAPDFSLQNLDGANISLSALKGKVVLINFWATWCAPCREEMPSMQKLWEKYSGEDFEMLAVNVGEDIGIVKEFKNLFQPTLSMPIVLDHHSTLVNTYPVIGLPTTYLIDKQGHFVLQAVGGMDWSTDEVYQVIEDMIGPKQTITYHDSIKLASFR